MRHRRQRGDRIVSGAVLLVIGIALLLSNLNLLELRPLLSHWWPLILVLIGVKQILWLRGPSALVGGLFWIGTGGLFLASTLGYIHISIASVVWPLMLIWFGVLIAMGYNGRCRSNCVEDGSDS